jgi:Uma2 family endonuclease
MATRLDSIHRFTPDDFRRMVNQRVVPPDAAELVDGQVVVNGALWRFSTDDYYRLLDAGVLTEDSRVELIHGEIIDMTAIGSRHAACVKRLNVLLNSRVSDSAIVSVQDPLSLADGIEPEPDIMLLRLRRDFYQEKHPEAADVLLLIEVADTSLGYDRGEKADLYAASEIVEYWLVDVDRRRVLVHTGPTPVGYAKIETMDSNAKWTSQTLPQLTVSGTDIFGE